jgi:hypothetical protein
MQQEETVFKNNKIKITLHNNKQHKKTQKFKIAVQKRK